MIVSLPRGEALKRSPEYRFRYRVEVESNPRTEPANAHENGVTKVKLRMQGRSRERSEKRTPQIFSEANWRKLRFVYSVEFENDPRTEPLNSYPKQSVRKQVHLQVQKSRTIENRTPQIPPKIMIYDAAKG